VDLCCQHPLVDPYPVPPVRSAACTSPGDRLPVAAPGSRTASPAGVGACATAIPTPGLQPGSVSAWPPSTGYIREAVDLLAACAPDLRQVIAAAARFWYVILGGTLIRAHRVADAR